MTLHSMTGFSRVNGAGRDCQFTWELKSVNSKGLDLRLRCPNGFDALESELRARMTRKLARGTVYATLSVQQGEAAPSVQINEPMLRAVIDLVSKLPRGDAIRPASLDGLLALKGIIEPVQAPEFSMETDQAAVFAALDSALEGLLAMRKAEGQAIAAVLQKRMMSVAALVACAEVHPARQPEAIAKRLAQNLALLLGQTALDPVRLHQEAVMLAAKADIREELDRLVAHVAAVRSLLSEGGPVGRRLDFLAQELSREVNTLCAKSNDVSLTALGLDLKTEVEQFREQVQNIE